MSRQTIFDREEVAGMRGLTSLTEPGPDDPVGAIVDLAVIGARGDGKTQFIVHAIRTLRAYAPLLEGAEHQYNRDVLEVVMNAREPRPEATAPGVVPHYVFRIRPRTLLNQVSLAARLALYRRAGGLTSHWLVALANAVVLGAALAGLRGGVDVVAILAALVLLGLGAALGALVARRRFVARGDIEIVFWDVAGEHVYSASAADYYGFLGALVRRRRHSASPERAYSFAPVLLCNPLALGTRPQGSAYTRLGQILPMFASLNEPLPRALVAINRWSVVNAICAPDADRDELVAVVPRPRTTDGVEDPASKAQEPSLWDMAPPLPVVKREVLRKHCLDAEDTRDSEVDMMYLRYDAGMQCEVRERPWPGWEALDPSIQTRWRPPREGEPKQVLDYVYEDGPSAFEGEVRSLFLHWLAGLAFDETSYRAGQAGQRAGQRADQRAIQTAPAPSSAAGTEAAFVEAAAGQGLRPQHGRPAGRPASEQAAPGAPLPAASPALAGETSLWSVERGAAGAGSAGRDPDAAWRPRPLSAHGLEDFARGAIATDLTVQQQATIQEPPPVLLDRPRTPRPATPAPAVVASEQANHPNHLAKTVIEPVASSAVSGPALSSPDSSGDPPGESAPESPGESPGDRREARHKGSTLRLPGGFGTSGT